VQTISRGAVADRIWHRPTLWLRRFEDRPSTLRGWKRGYRHIPRPACRHRRRHGRARRHGLSEVEARSTATGQEKARVLAEILQDEQARQALIDQLLQVAADGVASGAAAGEAVDPDDDVTIAREAAESLGEVTGEVTGWVARLRAA
jgi:hypothetical protein